MPRCWSDEYLPVFGRSSKLSCFKLFVTALILLFLIHVFLRMNWGRIYNISNLRFSCLNVAVKKHWKVFMWNCSFKILKCEQKRKEKRKQWRKGLYSLISIKVCINICLLPLLNSECVCNDDAKRFWNFYKEKIQKSILVSLWLKKT